MFMIMMDNEKTSKKPAKSIEALRQSIVERLKAHDAAIRSAVSETPQKTATPKNQ